MSQILPLAVTIAAVLSIYLLREGSLDQDAREAEAALGTGRGRDVTVDLEDLKAAGATRPRGPGEVASKGCGDLAPSARSAAGRSMSQVNSGGRLVYQRAMAVFRAAIVL